MAPSKKTKKKKPQHSQKQKINSGLVPQPTDINKNDHFIDNFIVSDLRAKYLSIIENAIIVSTQQKAELKILALHSLVEKDLTALEIIHNIIPIQNILSQEEIENNICHIIYIANIQNSRKTKTSIVTDNSKMVDFLKTIKLFKYQGKNVSENELAIFRSNLKGKEQQKFNEKHPSFLYLSQNNLNKLELQYKEQIKELASQYSKSNCIIKISLAFFKAVLSDSDNGMFFQEAMAKATAYYRNISDLSQKTISERLEVIECLHRINLCFIDKNSLAIGNFVIDRLTEFHKQGVCNVRPLTGVYLLISESQVRQKNFDLALKYIEDAYELYTNNKSVYQGFEEEAQRIILQRAGVNYKLGKDEQAIEYLIEAQEFDIYHEDILMREFEMYKNLGLHYQINNLLNYRAVNSAMDQDLIQMMTIYYQFSLENYAELPKSLSEIGIFNHPSRIYTILKISLAILNDEFDQAAKYINTLVQNKDITYINDVFASCVYIDKGTAHDESYLNLLQSTIKKLPTQKNIILKSFEFTTLIKLEQVDNARDVLDYMLSNCQKHNLPSVKISCRIYINNLIQDERLIEAEQFINQINEASLLEPRDSKKFLSLIKKLKTQDQQDIVNPIIISDGVEDTEQKQKKITETSEETNEINTQNDAEVKRVQDSVSLIELAADDEDFNQMDYIDPKVLHAYCLKQKALLQKSVKTKNMLGSKPISWVIDDEVYSASDKDIYSVVNRDGYYVMIDRKLADKHCDSTYLNMAKTAMQEKGFVTRDSGMNGLKIVNKTAIELKLNKECQFYTTEIYKNDDGQILIKLNHWGSHKKVKDVAQKKLSQTISVPSAHLSYFTDEPSHMSHHDEHDSMFEIDSAHILGDDEYPDLS